jgi:hypothetical protein
MMRSYRFVPPMKVRNPLARNTPARVVRTTGLPDAKTTPVTYVVAHFLQHLAIKQGWCSGAWHKKHFPASTK